AGGVLLQADSPGAFTAQVEAFAGTTSLGTFSLASDASGDPVFIGAQDTLPEITSLVFSMTSCASGCDENDFAVDTLLSENASTTAVPEPASLSLFGAAVIGLSSMRRRKKQR